MTVSEQSERLGWIRLTNRDELLWRQVPPGWFVKDRITSQVFASMPSQHGFISVARSAVVSAEEAYRRHLGRGNPTIGVVGVSVGEVEAAPDIEGHRLSVWDDTVEPDTPPEHATVDATIHSSKCHNKGMAAFLADIARRRGWMHGPIGSGGNRNAESLPSASDPPSQGSVTGFFYSP
jgi:hypothetical protein